VSARVLPKGLHRIRHYGLLAGPARAGNLARMRELLAVPAPAAAKAEAQAPDQPEQSCPCCGGRMRIIEIFERGCAPRYPTKAATRREAGLTGPNGKVTQLTAY
jgi:hypothetical protein